MHDAEVELKDPQAIGLDPAYLTMSASLEELVSKYRKALALGDVRVMHHLLTQLHIMKVPVERVADAFLLQGYRFIRTDCEHPSEKCAVLHRALDLTRELSHLVSQLWTPQLGVSSAGLIMFADVGYYMDCAAVYVAEAIAMSNGFQTHQLGSDVPLEVILGAIPRFSPRALWLSASGPSGTESMKNTLNSVTSLCSKMNTKLVIMQEGMARRASGRASVTQMQNFADFSVFCKGLAPPSALHAL
jgi:hypothetical protein